MLKNTLSGSLGEQQVLCCGNKRQMLKATAFSSSLKLLKVFLQLEGNSHEENLIAYLHCKKTLEDKERKITCP